MRVCMRSALNRFACVSVLERAPMSTGSILRVGLMVVMFRRQEHVHRLRYILMCNVY